MRIRSDPIVCVQDVTVAYEDTVILDHISFEVYRGEVFAILGESGCGKSTLLKHMIGLYTPISGRILLNGEDITMAEGSERLRLLQKIGVLYQRNALFGSLTLLENVALPLQAFTDLPAEAIRLIAQMQLHLVGLDGLAHRMPAELSGGMQKRAALARAMALDPDILFLDEPSSGLDPITSAGLDRLFIRLNRTLNMTFIVVTHELASIDAITDRVIMLDKQTKRIVATGRPQELREHCDNAWVRHFFRREVAAEP